jgi:hypothetical protein
LVLCEKGVYSVAEVHYVGVNGAMDGPGHAAGGFAILSPLPPMMWGPDTVFKLSLRRVKLPDNDELNAALHKEHAKLPARLEMLRNIGSVVKLDAGRKLQECTLEVSLKHMHDSCLRDAGTAHCQG